MRITIKYDEPNPYRSIDDIQLSVSDDSSVADMLDMFDKLLVVMGYVPSENGRVINEGVLEEFFG